MIRQYRVVDGQCVLPSYNPPGSRYPLSTPLVLRSPGLPMRFAILNPPSSRCSGRERMAPPARHEGTPISIFPSPMKTMFMDAELASEP